MDAFLPSYPHTHPSPQKVKWLAPKIIVRSVGVGVGVGVEVTQFIPIDPFQLFIFFMDSGSISFH